MASAQRPPAAPDRKKLSAVGAIDNNQTDPNSQSHYKDNSTLDNVIAIVGSVLGVLGFIVAVVKLHFTSKKLKLKKRQIEAQKRTNERTNKDKQREIEIHQERNKLIEEKKQNFEDALQTILPFIYKFNLGSLRNKVCPIF